MRNCPSLGRGLDAVFSEPIHHQLSYPTYRGIFGSIKSFWTVMDPNRTPISK